MYTTFISKMLVDGTCFILLLVLGVYSYRQTDYIIIPERAEVASVNLKYANVTIRNFKYNRTALASNFTFNIKTNFRYDLKVNVQALKFASNEYRQFPLIFSADVCELLNKDDFGMQNIYKCGNAAKCPLVKGNYSICNFTPDYSKFPPYIPTGRYRLDLIFVYMSDEVAYVQYFITIKSSKWGTI